MFNSIPTPVLKMITKNIPADVAIQAAAKFNLALQQKAISLQPQLQHNGIVAFILLPNTDTYLPTDTQLNAIEVYQDETTEKFLFGDNLLGDDISITEFAATINVPEAINQAITQKFDISKLFKEETPLGARGKETPPMPANGADQIHTEYEQRIFEENQISQAHSFTGTQPAPIKPASPVENQENPNPHE